MVNLGARDKHVLKTTICKSGDSEGVQRIIVFPYLPINPLGAFMFKGQDHVSRFPPSIQALFWSMRLTMHSVPLGYCSSTSFHASSLHVPYIACVVK